MFILVFARDAFLKRQPHIRKLSRPLHIIQEEDEPRAPRARSPPRTPSPRSSSDPFHLTNTDTSYQFPHPPVSTPSPSRRGSVSPTPSMSTSDASTSPDSLSSDLPTTPSSSDDEFPSYYSSAWPSFNARRASIRPLSITKRNPQDSERFNDSQCEDDGDESDSEWYTREFSKILTLNCTLPPCTPHQQKSRPESIYIPSTSTNRRILAFPSSHLDPAFPRSTPPPVPPKPKSRKTHLSLRRPPPRSSIPADCVFLDSGADASNYAFSDDSTSVFSFSLYDSLPTPTPTSPESSYSQSSPTYSPYPPSFPSSATSDEFEFDLDLELDDLEIQFASDTNIDSTILTLPALPTSPIDLEADIAHGLEELRLRPAAPAPAPTSTPPRPHNLPEAEATPDRVLRSKWSASTLNSIREDQGRRTASSKLRAYFSTSLPSPTFTSRTRSSTSSHKTPSSASPSRLRSKQRRELYAYAHPPCPSPNATATRSAGPDVVIMGYGHEGVPVKRRRSVTGLSDAGSEDSSASLVGLRRKPIPVEMFLRQAAI